MEAIKSSTTFPLSTETTHIESHDEASTFDLDATTAIQSFTKYATASLPFSDSELTEMVDQLKAMLGQFKNTCREMFSKYSTKDEAQQNIFNTIRDTASSHIEALKKSDTWLIACSPEDMEGNQHIPKLKKSTPCVLFVLIGYQILKQELMIFESNQHPDYTQTSSYRERIQLAQPHDTEPKFGKVDVGYQHHIEKTAAIYSSSPKQMMPHIAQLHASEIQDGVWLKCEPYAPTGR